MARTQGGTPALPVPYISPPGGAVRPSVAFSFLPGVFYCPVRKRAVLPCFCASWRASKNTRVLKKALFGVRLKSASKCPLFSKNSRNFISAVFKGGPLVSGLLFFNAEGVGGGLPLPVCGGLPFAMLAFFIDFLRALLLFLLPLFLSLLL